MSFNKIPYIMVLLFFNLCVFAGIYEIQGSIKDAKDGSTLPGANIQVIGTSIGTATDLAGEYSLYLEQDEVPKLLFTYIGYHAETLLVAKSGKHNIKLRAKTETLEAVQVMGKKTGRFSDNEGMSYGSDQLKDRKDQGLSSVGELLDGLAGVNLQVCCALDNRASLSLLGLPGEYTEITIDGAPEVCGLASAYRLYSYPAIGIDKIMVKKGAASVKSESKSIGGHVDIVTRQPKDGPPEGSVSMYQRSVGGTELQAELTSQQDNFGTQFAFSFLRANMYDRNDDGWSESPDKERLFSRFKVYLGEEGYNHLNITGLYIDEEVTGGMTDVARIDVGNMPNWVRSVNTDRWETNIDGGFRLGNGRVIANVTGAAVNLDQIVDSTETVIDEMGIVVRTAYETLLFGQEFFVEGQYRFEKTEDKQESILDREDDRISLSASRNFGFGDKTDLEVGIRTDGDGSGDDRDWQINPRLSLESRITPFFKLQARAGSGGRFRPSNQDLLSGYSNTVIVNLPNDLESEQGITGNIASEYKMFIGSTIVTLAGSGYYTSIDGRILPYSEGDGSLSYRNADSKTDIFGGEANLLIDIVDGPLIHLGGEGTRTDHNGNELPFIPRWRGFGRLKWMNFLGIEGLKLMTTTMIYGEQVLPENTYGETASEAFSTTTVAVSKKFGKFLVCLSSQNLFDITQDISPLQGTSDPFATGVSSELVYGPLVGRTISMSFVFRFGGSEHFKTGDSEESDCATSCATSGKTCESSAPSPQSVVPQTETTDTSQENNDAQPQGNDALRRNVPSAEVHPPGCSHTTESSNEQNNLKKEIPKTEEKKSCCPATKSGATGCGSK